MPIRLERSYSPGVSERENSDTGFAAAEDRLLCMCRLHDPGRSALRWAAGAGSGRRETPQRFAHDRGRRPHDGADRRVGQG